MAMKQYDITLHLYNYNIHSKNSRVRFDPERVPWCQTQFWVRPTRKPGQTDPESEAEKHFWFRFRVSLTQIPDQSDPEMGLAPFPRQISPGVFRV